MAYRLRRVVLTFLLLVLLGAGVALFTHNPVGWVKDRWYDVRNTLVEVTDVRAIAEPAGSALSNYPAASSVDRVLDSAWATSWTPDATMRDHCGPLTAKASRTSAGSLRLVLEHPATVRAISVASGLPATDPLSPNEWRPKTLRLVFSDGTCRDVELKDTADLQQVAFEPADTTEVGISVVDGYPPSGDQAKNVASISEVLLFSRP